MNRPWRKASILPLFVRSTIFSFSRLLKIPNKSLANSSSGLLGSNIWFGVPHRTPALRNVRVITSQSTWSVDRLKRSISMAIAT